MTTYYVDGDNGNDSNDGLSSGAPKKTIPSHSASDTVNFKRGSTVSLTSQYSLPGNGVTWQDYGADDALPRIVDGGLPATHHLLLLNNIDDCIIQNLYLQRADDAANYRTVYLTGASSNGGHIVQDCEIVGGQTGTVRIAANVPAIQILRNRIHGGGEDGIWARCGDGTVIRGNTIYDCSTQTANGDGIELSEHTGTVHIVDNAITLPNASHKQAIIVSSTQAGADCLVAGNRAVLVDGDNQYGIYLSCAGVVRANLLTGAMARGMHIASSANDQRQHAYGNIVDCRGYAVTDYGLAVVGTHTGKALVISHNDLLGQWTHGIYLFQAGGGTLSVDGNIVDFDGKAATGNMINKGGSATLTVDSADQNAYFNGGGGASGLTATNTLTSDPDLDGDYLPRAAAYQSVGTWRAGVRAHDDLPLPLHPDIGAAQDRTATGRNFGAGR